MSVIHPDDYAMSNLCVVSSIAVYLIPISVGVYSAKVSSRACCSRKPSLKCSYPFSKVARLLVPVPYSSSMNWSRVCRVFGFVFIVVFVEVRGTWIVIRILYTFLSKTIPAYSSSIWQSNYLKLFMLNKNNYRTNRMYLSGNLQCLNKGCS